MPDMSATWAQKTWVYHLQKKIPCEIVNISRVGCGNLYIHDAVLAEVTERQYDLVIVTWTVANRAEFRTQYTLPLFDWDKFGGNPHDSHMQKDWIFPHTPDSIIPFDEAINTKNELMRYRLKSLPEYEVNHQTMLTQVISLQSTLKSYGTPYMFAFYRKILQLKKFSNYYNKIDWANIIDHNLYTKAKTMNMWDNDTLHPTEEAYQWYADEIIEFLNTKNLITP
jgi:hypothetical protein